MSLNEQEVAHRQKVRARSIREEIFESIEKERDYQDGKWGTDFDDKNTANDWATYIGGYAAASAPLQLDKGVFETKMLKVAALAVAAIEASRRNGGPAPRHYDKFLSKAS